jgi:hypothetical protein
MTERRALLRRLARYLVVTLVLGALATLLFATLHALVIVPIWRRMLGGVPLALFGAAAMTLFFGELRRAGEIGRGPGPVLAFGALAWLSVLPATAYGALLRALHLHRGDALEVAGALVVAGATGAAFARLRRMRWRWVLASAAFVATLVLVMAGPIPVTNGRRPVLLLLGFLPLFVGLSAVLGLCLGRGRDAEAKP